MRLSPAEQKVLDALVSPRTRMELIESTGMARETVQRALEGLDDKGVARRLAMERFPSEARLFARVKDDGRAESALIAAYGWETFA